MKRISLAGLLCLLTLTLTACAGAKENSHSKVSEKPVVEEMTLSERAYSLKTRESCEAENGTWQRVGLAGRLSCILPTTDAGKACTDGSQCQVTCMLKERNIAPGTAVTGQCHDSTQRFGCRAYVSGGKAGHVLCID